MPDKASTMYNPSIKQVLPKSKKSSIMTVSQFHIQLMSIKIHNMELSKRHTWNKHILDYFK